MDDMNPLERQVARDAVRDVGPIRPVDDLAIFTAVSTTRSPKWRIQSMFTATKFVVAGVIVALFGGFLLAGVLTQPSEESVPAVGASASSPPEADAAEQSVRSDLLPGVDLATEKVEPGVYRIVSDGVRDLAALDDPTIPHGRAYSLVVGQDGGVWRIGPDREFFQLGDPVTHEWMEEPALVGDEDIEIAPNGTIWSANEWRPDGAGKGMHLMSFDGASWTDEGASGAEEDTRIGVKEVEIGADGSVWAYGAGGLFLVEADGWTRWPSGFGDRFHISEDGTRWFTGNETSIWRDRSDRRDTDPSWEPVGLDLAGHLGTGITSSTETAVSPDGTVWMHVDRGDVGDSLLARFDGNEWSSWTEEDGVPSHIETESWWGLAITAAPDGSVWLVSGQRDDDGAVCDQRGSTIHRRVSRFDGTAWSHYLDDLCIHALDVTPDGAAWVRASSTGAETDPVDFYVITPEAVAAAVSEPAPAESTDDTTTTTHDLLPGVDLVTEEVEPGVYRVIEDGRNDLSENIWHVAATAGQAHPQT